MDDDPIQRLREVMRKLRDPQGGCPWDMQQNFASIVPYTIEEAYEVADAIEREDWTHLRGELGDLLFQVVFHARMAEERGWFDFDDVAEAIVDKLVRRHPHVFGGERIESAEAQSLAWERHKENERGARDHTSVLDDVPRALPSLKRAAKLQKRAARTGFDWDDIRGVWCKVEEECNEVRAELDAAAENPAALTHEIGDLLFAVVNLARHAGIDPEAALHQCNRRFERRFAFIEEKLRERGTHPDQASLEEMDALWEQAKKRGL